MPGWPGWPGLPGLGRSSCEMHFGGNGKAPPEAGLSGEKVEGGEGRESQFINFEWPQPGSLVQVLGNASSGLQPGLRQKIALAN
uniref:GG14484 n=1 Tax=Drosophila erecta TaxID=7220 RepID=B3NZZ6_DROER